jgi:tetratricopeptide (TPR) repeat protein
VPAKSGSTIYQRAWIWNAKLPWRFNHDTAHETIVLDMDGMGENFRKFNLPMSYRQVGFDDGESWSSPTKYVSDALKLEEKMIRENTMLTDLYHFWYIGKSYYDAYKAVGLPLKQKHNNELARRSIFYCLEFLDVTHNYGTTGKADRMDEMGYYAMMMVGNSYRYLGDYQNAIKHLELAEEFCPTRNEHLTNIAEIYNDLQDYDKMFLVTNKMTNPSRKNPFPHLSFIIESQCYPDTGTYVHELHQIAQSNAKKTNPETNNPQFNLKVSM